jgi:hypothetical protein
MADKTTLEQMLEHLVNDDKAKAEELFHEYVVSKSREIYENLIDSELAEEEEKDEDEDEEMDEAASDEDAEEDKVDEEFEDIAIEGDDDAMGGDPTDELEAELGDDEGEEGEASEEEIMQDIGEIIDELQAKFDALQGEEEAQGEFDMGDDEEEKKEEFDTELETVREYVEKVAAPKGGDGGANAKSVVAGKNDMGGSSANILKGGVEAESASTKGGLLNPSPKEDNAGNINVPGGKAGSAFSKKEPGHGAEKKGAAEQADNKQSLFRGRR